MDIQMNDSIEVLESSNDSPPPAEPPIQNNRYQGILQTAQEYIWHILLGLGALTVITTCIVYVIKRGQNYDVTHSVDMWIEELSEEKQIWFADALSDLKHALTVKTNTRRAKNVILFVGDGMGVNTVTASRIYKHGESGRLSWEHFPHMGMLKTYCADRQVPDSAAAATALFGGVKGNYETSGVDSVVPSGQCNESLQKDHQVHSILEWAQNANMGSGFVTTTRVTHATPAALYAHVPSRRWECEKNLNEHDVRRGCKDIARQLVEDKPGRDLNVIMGGGRQCLMSNVTGTPKDPVDTWACYSDDGRDLISEWYRSKSKKQRAIASNNQQLHSIIPNQTEYLMGIFANGHMSYDHERDISEYGMPSLANMTKVAIQVLQNQKNGFVLVVEGGLIDQAHHRGWAKRALSETIGMDDAVKVAMETLKDELDDTLIIVTSDHAHSLNINGYPKKGTSILDIAQKSKADQVPYTTLTYSAGGPLGYQISVDESGKPVRRDPSTSDTFAYDYVQQVGIMTDENVHGGGDVSIHAIGPMAHLFHRTHEQSYVAHVIAYAARIGRFQDKHVVEMLMNLLGM